VIYKVESRYLFLYFSEAILKFPFKRFNSGSWSEVCPQSRISQKQNVNCITFWAR